MHLYRVGKEEDAPHQTGDEGYASLVVRQDTVASLAGVDGDYSMLSVDDVGRLYVATAGIPSSAAGDIIERAETPIITAGAYTAEDTFGDRLVFASAVEVAGGAGVITKVQILSNALQSSPIDLWLFTKTFTAGNDNDPFAVSDADLQNCLGYIDITAADYSIAANNEQACVTRNTRMPFEFVLSGTSLFGQMKILAGDTYGATDDVTVVLTIERL